MSEFWIIITVVFVLLAAVYGIWYWRTSKRQPTNEMLLSHTFTHILEGNHHGVLERMRRLYEQTGHDVGVGLALGNLLRNLGKYKVAIRTHLSLTTRSELSDEVSGLIHTELAADYLASGLLSRAQQSLETALLLQKPDELLSRYAEEIYERLGDYDAASKVLVAFGKNGGEDSGQRIALLRCRQAQRAWEAEEAKEANDALKKAFSADETCLPAYLLNSRILRESGKPDKARAYLNKHMAKFDGQAWLVIEELKYVAIHDGGSALFIDAAERHLQKDPEDWRAHGILGSFLRDTGEYQQAADALLRALEIAPRVLKLHQDIWSLMLHVGDLSLLQRYRDHVKKELVFSKPYRCQGCSHDSETLAWRCPTCHRIYSFTERKI